MTGLASRRWTLIAALSTLMLALGSVGEAAADPDITLEPVGGLAFGDVRLGGAAEVSVGVFNDGTSAGTIGAISVSGSLSFTIALDDCAGLVLETDEFCVVTMRFAPMASGAQAAQLSVASDDPASPDLLALSGTGVEPPVVRPSPPQLPPPSLGVAPLALDFGVVPVGGNRAARHVAVTNGGSGGLTVTSRIDGPDAGAFTSRSTCVNPVTVSRGCSVDVVFAPKREGRNQATLVIESRGGVQAVALSGIGTAPTPRPGLSKEAIKLALWDALRRPVDQWRQTNRLKVRRAKGFRLKAPRIAATGTLSLELRTTDRRNRLVAKGTSTYPPFRSRVVIANLTKAGKGLLRKKGKRRLRAVLTFVTAGGARVASARSFTLPD